MLDWIGHRGGWTEKERGETQDTGWEMSVQAAPEATESSSLKSHFSHNALPHIPSEKVFSLIVCKVK